MGILFKTYFIIVSVRNIFLGSGPQEVLVIRCKITSSELSTLIPSNCSDNYTFIVSSLQFKFCPLQNRVLNKIQHRTPNYYLCNMQVVFFSYFQVLVTYYQETLSILGAGGGSNELIFIMQLLKYQRFLVSVNIPQMHHIPQLHALPASLWCSNQKQPH